MLRLSIYQTNVSTSVVSNTDIDECQTGQHLCVQNCFNTLGGYRCDCYDGYLLNVTDRTSCYGMYINICMVICA